MSRSEIRRDADGAVDDVVLLDAAMVRLERMDEGAWWLAVYPRGGGAPVVIWLSARQPGRARVEATVTELGDLPVVRVGP